MWAQLRSPRDWVRRPSHRVRVVLSAGQVTSCPSGSFPRVAGELGLDADDADGGVGELDGGSDAAEQSASGDGRENEIDVGKVFKDFEAAGALSGDDLLVVVGRDHDVAVISTPALRL